MFKFVKVKYKIHPKIDRYEEEWFLLLDNFISFEQFINQRQLDLVNTYFHLKRQYIENPILVRSGHLDGMDEEIINLRMELDATRRTLVDDSRVLDSLLEGYISLFNEYGKILINKNNGCRPFEKDYKILETVENKGIVFPTISKKDIIVKQWENSKHYYVRVGNYDLPDKYFTYESGYKAGEKYLQKRIKND